ncbi:MAG TPA: class I SAM-dependent methyltransferase [Ktedonobacterales bacterium]
MDDIQEPTYGRLYIETTMQWTTDERTRREVSFLLDELHVSPESRILDVGCNRGRHAIELAQRGYACVTGIDPDAEAISYAREASAQGRLSVAFECGDAEALTLADFDAAYCIGTSIGFHDTDEGDLQQLRAVFAALKPETRFVLELTSLLAQQYGDGVRRTWYQHGDLFVLDEGSFDALTCRARHIWRYIGEGAARVREERYRVYAPQEILSLVRQAGFTVRDVYGDYERHPFSLTTPALIAVCDRP